MAEWIWVGICTLSFAATIPLSVRALRQHAPHAELILGFAVLGYMTLAALFMADAFVERWADPTLRFARGCAAGLGIGAILGVWGLLVARGLSSRR